MRLLSINIWNGNFIEQVVEFINSANSDIVCLQEVTSFEGSSIQGSFETFSDKFRNYSHFYTPTSFYFSDKNKVFRGNMVMVAEGIDVVGFTERFIYREMDELRSKDEPRNLQHLRVLVNGRNYSIINTHLPVTGPEHRESGTDPTGFGLENLIDYIESSLIPEEPLVLCGDFNIEQESQDIKEIELIGLRNLCKEYGITTTRTIYAKKSSQVIDYIFTRNLNTVDFSVPDVLISDHYPLSATFR